METIRIGEIVSTHGLKGEVKVRGLSDFPNQRFKKGNTIYVEFHNEMIPFEIASYKIQQQTVYLVFNGYEDINLIEKYKHCFLYIDKNLIHSLKKGEYYYFQLKGLEALDQLGRYLGKVVEIVETGANNCLRIKGENKEFLVPYVPSFIKSVDLEAQTITINVIEGLL